MSAAPFASLTESFLEDKFGIIEGELSFDFGNHFEVTVSGSYPTGAEYWERLLDSDAIQLLDEMFVWRGTA